MEYKDTLLMPKTDFPMRGNLPNKEPEWQAKWEEEKLYEKIQEKMLSVRLISYMMDLHMQTVKFIWVTL